MRDVTASATGVNTFNNCAKEDSRYYHGHQWPDLDRMRMEQLRRPALVFNEIGDKIDAISGLERLNRQDVHAVSRTIDSDMLHDASGDLASESSRMRTRYVRRGIGRFSRYQGLRRCWHGLGGNTDLIR